MAQAVSYSVAIGLVLAVLEPAGYLAAGPLEAVELLVQHRVVVFVVATAVYVVSSASLAVLALALHERAGSGGPALARVATAFGLVWAGVLMASGMVAGVGASAVVDLAAQDPERAASLWLAVGVVHDGLGGGTEVVGGLWVLLVSRASLRSSVPGRPALPRALSHLGAVLGVAGVLTLLPPLQPLTAVFGLGMVVWFAAVGAVLVRTPSPQIGGSGPDVVGRAPLEFGA